MGDHEIDFQAECERLTQRLRQQDKITAALMKRVELSMDKQDDSFSLFQAAAALESEVRDRTASLESVLHKLETTNRELVLARDKANNANLAKSEFLANISHEIRTPMNGVLGMTELLLGTEMNLTQKRFARTIQRSASSLLRIINDLLDYSKMEAGKFELDSVAFDLLEHVEDVTELMGEPAQASGLELLCSFPSDLPSVYLGDPLRIRQILVNLVGNAIKFTSEGQVLISVASTLGDDSRHAELRIEVSDTGIGIPLEAQQKIFQSFAQADGSTTRTYGGTGLGLSISSQLVHLMGGEMGVNSTPGEGATFWFSLTLPLESSNGTNRVRSLGELNRARILVVDDNATNLEILKHQLEGWGSHVELVQGGAEAMELLHSDQLGHFDLAILDYHMPGVTGLELVREMRDKPAYGDVPVLMLSSVSQNLTELEKDQGVAPKGELSFLTKPIRCFELRRCLMQMLAKGDLEETVQAEPVMVINETTQSLRILLAEDNAVNREVAVTMLQHMGHHPTAAKNGAEAFEAMQSESFDLILMDLQMPVMGGLQATAEIRQFEEANGIARGERTPVIALTANAVQGDRDRCLQADMDDYLSKPFSQAQLHGLLMKWGSRRVESMGPVGFEEVENTLEPKASDHSLTSPEALDAGAGQGTENSGMLDRSALESILALGGSGLLERLIDLFLETTAPQAQAIHKAWHEKDLETLGHQAHGLKSASSNLGATELAGICQAIESLSAIDDCESTLNNFQRVYLDTCVALQQEREGDIHE